MINWLHLYSNIIGIIGVVMVLVVYLLLQLNRLSQADLVFSVVNCIGSLMILVSLAYHWNLASFIIEIAWLMISLFGVVRCLVRPRASLLSEKD